jgi:hypothetical protein
MNVDSKEQLVLTRDKLRLLERTFEQAQRDSSGTAHARELTLRSPKRLINQLKEEIARHEARVGVPARKT